MEGLKAISSTETLTIVDIVSPAQPDDVDENPEVKAIFEDVKKLDFPKDGEIRNYSPDDLINYNDGLQANPFNKIAKVYGRHKDVFLFVGVVFSKTQRETFLSIVKEKCDGDVNSMEQFMKKMKVYMKRISKGVDDAKGFLPEELQDCPAFFNGYHVEQLPAHGRNIHENLNVNITKKDTKLEVDALLNREIPGGEEGKSQLRRLKIYANGQRAMTVYKEDGGERKYTPAKGAEMDLEIKWIATDPKSQKEVECLTVLNFEEGRVAIKTVKVDGNELLKTDSSILELAKQNVSIRIRNKSLYELMEKKISKATADEGLIMFAKVIASLASIQTTDTEKVREQITPVRFPKQVETAREIMEAVCDLDFSDGPFDDSEDELNFNDGIPANPFDKLAKTEGKQRNVFLFNRIIRDPQHFGRIMKIVSHACGGDLQVMKAFIMRKDIYLKRIVDGEVDGKEIIEDDFSYEKMDLFTHGYHVARNGHARNIHANLNINLMAAGKSLNTSRYFTKVTPRMEEEKSNLERVKIYGNGQKLLDIIKKRDVQRNYNFSELADIDMDIGWRALKSQKEGEREVPCALHFSISSGIVSGARAYLDGIPVDIEEMLEVAKQHTCVLVNKQSLHTILRGFLPEAKNMEMTMEVNKKENSKEKLIIHEIIKGKDDASCSVQSLYEDVEKLDFSSELCKDPNDEINYNEGLKANQFCKLRKYWSRRKNILQFTSALETSEVREKILEVAVSKYGDNVKGRKGFEKHMNTFLERMKTAREDAEEFLKEVLKDYDGNGVSAVFAGYHVPQKGRDRNIHENLNVKLGKSKPELDWPTSDFFRHATSRMNKENSSLSRIKIFGEGQKIMTIVKDENGQRNYIYSNLAVMDLGIEWLCKSDQRKCELLLKIDGGIVDVGFAKADGRSVSITDILEMAKKNKEVLLRNKTLYDVLSKLITKKGLAQKASGIAIGSGVSDAGASAYDEFVVIDTLSETEDGNGDASSEDVMGQW